MTYQYRAHVDRIVDGDTIGVIVDLGFRVYTNQRLRLFGIDTPERGQEGWSEATNYLASLIPPGTRVTIETEKGDKYGRWIATITDSDGLDINKAMIESGLAKYY